MAQVCPTCNTALDPTHAPVARVRAAKVVTYCSVECANQSDTGAVVAPKEIAKTAAATPGVVAESRASAPNAAAKPAAPKAPEKAATGSPKPPKKDLAPAAKPSASKAAAREAVPVAIAPDAAVPVQEHSPKKSGRRTKILVACALVMMGGIAIAVVQLMAPKDAAPVPEESQKVSETKTEGVEDAAHKGEQEAGATQAALPAPAVLRAAAIKELESHLGTGAPRFQRLAGIALARIKHPGAVASLVELLSKEDSDLSRIDIAYGMALGGEASGREYLVNELKSPRRDVRIDAARRLVQLGDDAGRSTLLQMLNVKSHRLGAASVLALLGDEEGLDVLRKTLTEKDASEENRMRAAVGLGRAGDEGARPLLLEILREGRYVVDAAGALATLGEQEALPALERQLELTAMRVVAAESLRGMGASVDLALLASALVHENEEGRIAAAEAILVLTPEDANN